MLTHVNQHKETHEVRVSAAGRVKRRHSELYVPEDWDEQSQKERHQIHRGRRGQRALQKMIRQALRGRAEQHCQALNAFHSSEGPLGRSRRRWPDFPAKKEQAFRLAFGADLATRPQYQRTIGRLILTRALEDVRSIFDQMIKEHEPRAARVQMLVLDRLAFFLIQAANHSRTIDELVPRAELSESQKEELLRAEAAHPFYIIGASALLNLWKESDEWLRRLRRCGYPRCDTPYFLDRTTARRSRFCGPKHRQYDRRRRLKET
jgi:hypothetical protein